MQSFFTQSFILFGSRLLHLCLLSLLALLNLHWKSCLQLQTGGAHRGDPTRFDSSLASFVLPSVIAFVLFLHVIFISSSLFVRGLSLLVVDLRSVRLVDSKLLIRIRVVRAYFLFLFLSEYMPIAARHRSEVLVIRVTFREII